MELIKNSPGDCYETVQKTTVIVLTRLQALLTMEHQIASSSERSQFHDLQSLLCATLQNVVRKIKLTDAPQISDVAMQTLLQILAVSSNRKVGGVQEDALSAISTFVEGMDICLSSDFLTLLTISFAIHHFGSNCLL